MSERVPKSGRQWALSTAPMSLWKRQRARRISAAEFELQIRWLRWAEREHDNVRSALDWAAFRSPTH